MKNINKKPLKWGKIRTDIIKHKYTANESSGDVELIDLVVNKNGTFYPEPGKAFKSVTVDIKEIVGPKVVLALSPSTTLYNKKVDTVSEIVITATVTKGTDNVKSVAFALNGTTVETITDGVASGGIFTYTHTFSPATNTDFKFKVTVEDVNNKTASTEKEVRFVYKSYWGTVADTVTSPTASDILALANNGLVGTKAYVYSGITMDYGKVVYAYPTTFGSLTSIMDTVHSFDYTNSFTKTTVEIDGVPYYCYTLTDPSAADNVQLTFA